MWKHVAAVALSAAIAVIGSTISFAADKPKIGVVVKIGGIPWFNRMEVGIREQAEKLGVEASMVGPTATDPALQVKAIEDMIAQGVQAIGVVPNDAKAIAPVLKKARDQGIYVITHESPNQEGNDWNFELSSPVPFGEASGELLAKTMGYKGEYVVYVGSLTVPLHNAWADAAIAYIKRKYPEMTMIGDRQGVAENVDLSRSTTLDLLAAHPNLKGVLAFGSQGPIGAGRAIVERRKVGKVFIVGSFTPSQGVALMKQGALVGGYRWNSRTAGRIFVTLADKLIKGEKIKDGDDIQDLGVIHPDFDKRNIVVNGLEEINVKTIDAMVAEGH